jgi:hypothetical protein
MAEEQTITEALIYDGATIGDATITVTPSGQEDPDTSDQVYVTVELELPAVGTEHVDLEVLHAHLRFGAHVATVFGASLTEQWSNVTEKVARSATYTGTDYAALMATAEAYGTTELAKLTTALAARQAALDAAG